MPNLTKIEREWGMRLARQLLDGEVSLKFADDDIRGFNITRIDVVGFVLKAGGFEIQGAASQDINDAQSQKTVRMIEKMLLDRLFGLSAVNYLWDKVGHEKDTLWKSALCTHLTAKGICALLVTEPSHAFKSENTGMLPLAERIVQHIPEDKHAGIIQFAQKQRKLAVLYKHTGWEGCRELAMGTERDAMIGSDLGL